MKYEELFQTRSFLRDQREEAELQTRTYDRWILRKLGYSRQDPDDTRVREITTILLPEFDTKTRYRNNGEHLVEYEPSQTANRIQGEMAYWNLEDCLLKIHPDLGIFSFSPSRPYLRILPLDLLDPGPQNLNWYRR